jgi:hypothetical protein
MQWATIPGDCVLEPHFDRRRDAPHLSAIPNSRRATPTDRVIGGFVSTTRASLLDLTERRWRRVSSPYGAFLRSPRTSLSMAPTETLRDELQMLAKVMLQEYRRRLPFIRRLIEEAVRDPEFGPLLYQKFLMQGRLQFTDFLAKRQERREIGEDVDIEAAAAMFFSAITGILVVVELFGGNKVEVLDEERLVREFSSVLLSGIVKR